MSENPELVAAYKLLVASADVANSENIKLRADNERMRAALKYCVDTIVVLTNGREMDCVNIARAALADQGKG